jgi:hypothetical protein
MTRRYDEPRPNYRISINGAEDAMNGWLKPLPTIRVATISNHVRTKQKRREKMAKVISVLIMVSVIVASAMPALYTVSSLA